MKLKKVTASTQTATTNQQVEKLLKESEPRIMAEAIQESKDYAMAGIPGQSDNANLTLYTQNTTTSWKSVMSKMWQILGAENAYSQGGVIKKSLAQEKENLETKIPEIQNEIRIQQMEYKKYDITLPAILKAWKWAIVGISFMTLGEFSINIYAFSLLTGGNLIASAIAAIALSIVLFSASLGQDYIFKKVNNKITKWVYTILLASFVFLLLYGLAHIRFAFLEMQDDRIKDHIKPIYFAIGNFGFYLASVILTLRYSPSLEERRAYEDFKNAKKQMDKLEAELQGIKNRIIEIPKELNRKLTEFYGVLVMAHNYEHQIEALHHSTLGEFIKINITLQGGDTPPVFNQELPTLEKKYTHIINQENH